MIVMSEIGAAITIGLGLALSIGSAWYLSVNYTTYECIKRNIHEPWVSNEEIKKQIDDSDDHVTVSQQRELRELLAKRK